MKVRINAIKVYIEIITQVLLYFTQNLYIRDMKVFERTFAVYNPDSQPIRTIM